MKLRYILPLFILMILVLMAPGLAAAGQETGATSEFWWQVELDMSVIGSYRFSENNYTHDGRYSFEIHSTGALEQDMSKDYILYGGEPETTVLEWKESVPGAQNDPGAINLEEKIKPLLRLNYVLNESGSIYFDMEVFLETPHPDDSHPFSHFLLPRSALNKSINKKDKYNKNIVKGSNRVTIREKPILRKEETVKEFNWLWRRDKEGLLNSHSVVLTIKITRKIRD